MAREAIGSRIGYQAAQAGLFLEKPGLSLDVFFGAGSDGDIRAATGSASGADDDWFRCALDVAGTG
jgi:hypothetical protein